MDNNCDKEPKLCDLRLLQTIVRSKKVKFVEKYGQWATWQRLHTFQLKRYQKRQNEE
ncbi:hypothetical protein T4B_265 [Trichinella pseudospiralis]|uniref:Uncharacterized protein n=1 Tax=Trichinella pseudospiralis TaxID=6337 RepID=A0A0V1GCV8_TRIPS|nr:hypothetical protein T4B_265 [Trichinella pseudospiralis]